MISIMDFNIFSYLLELPSTSHDVKTFGNLIYYIIKHVFFSFLFCPKYAKLITIIYIIIRFVDITDKSNNQKSRKKYTVAYKS